MPPNDEPNVPCVKDDPAILPLEGAVNDLEPVVVFCLNAPFDEGAVNDLVPVTVFCLKVPFPEGAVNDLLPVVCRVNEPLREAAIVLLFAKVEPLVLVFVIPVRFVLKTVEEA